MLGDNSEVHILFLCRLEVNSNVKSVKYKGSTGRM